MTENKGFTLTEVLVAVFILSIAISAVLAVFPLGIKIQKLSQMTTVASELAQQKMEQIISQAYDEILVGTFEEDYGFNPVFNHYRRQTKITYFDPDNPQSIIENDLGIKKIEVSVFWRFPLGINEKEVKLVTLIAKK